MGATVKDIHRHPKSQIAKTRCYKSKTTPKPLHYLMKSAYSLMWLCNVHFHSSSKVVYQNIKPWMFTALCNPLQCGDEEDDVCFGGQVLYV